MKVPPELQRLIDRFRRLGFDAEFRNWSLGNSVFVGVGRKEHHADITAYLRSAYIAQRENGSWLILDFVENDKEFSEEAATEYLEWLMLCSDDEYKAEKRRLRLRNYLTVNSAKTESCDPSNERGR